MTAGPTLLRCGDLEGNPINARVGSKAKLIERLHDLASPILLSHRRVQGTSTVPLRNFDDLNARIRPQRAMAPQ